MDQLRDFNLLSFFSFPPLTSFLYLPSAIFSPLPIHPCNLLIPSSSSPFLRTPNYFFLSNPLRPFSLLILQFGFPSFSIPFSVLPYLSLPLGSTPPLCLCFLALPSPPVFTHFQQARHPFLSHSPVFSLLFSSHFHNPLAFSFFLLLSFHLHSLSILCCMYFRPQFHF